MTIEIETGAHKIVGCIGMFFGGSVVFVGLVLAAVTAINYSSLNRVEGVVVKYETDKGMHGRGPHVKYSVDNETYIASGQIHLDGGRYYKPGENMDVVYPAENPESGHLDLFREFWFKILLVLGVGSLMTLMAAVLRYGPGNKLLIVNKLKSQEAPSAS